MTRNQALEKARAARAAKREQAKEAPREDWYLHDGQNALRVGAPEDVIEVYCNGKLVLDLNWRKKEECNHG